MNNQNIEPNLQQQPSPVKPKKPWYKKWWIWVIIGAAATCALAAVLPKDDAKQESITVPTTGTTEVSTSKYSSNPYYADSVKALKDGAKLSDQEADAAFGVLYDCGLIKEAITYVFPKTDYKTGDPDGFDVWIKLDQYHVVFDDKNRIVKITDGTDADKVFYDNGKKVAPSSTIQPTTAAEPTEAPTEKPTEKPTESATPIKITNYTNYVQAGAKANVTIQGAPNTKYYIHVYYDSGESTAKGLEPKTSDDAGIVTWEWEVGAKTTPGTHGITVEGGGAKESVQFEVL